MGDKIDLTGKRFGRLLVVKEHEHVKGQLCVWWDCHCDCGNDIVVRSYSLRNGDTTSCGCYHNEVMSSQRKTNAFDLYADMCIGYDTKGKEFYFDIEDFEKISRHSWNVAHNGIVNTRINGKTMTMHKMITGTKKEIVDHKDGNPSNNTRSNLRVCTHQQNMFNRGAGKNNILGVKGVSLKSSGKYGAHIMKNGKNIHLGTFNTIEEAKDARNKAEVELFGDFACLDR